MESRRLAPRSVARGWTAFGSALVFLLVCLGVATLAVVGSVKMVVLVGVALVLVNVVMVRRLTRVGRWGPPSAQHHDRLSWLLLLVPILWTTLDSHAFLRTPGTAKFVLILAYEVALLMVVFTRRDSPRAVPGLPLFLLVTYMLLGSAYGKLHLGVQATILTAAVPLLVSLIPVVVPVNTPRLRGWAVQTLCWSLFAFTVVDTIGMLFPDQMGTVAGAYGHEKAYLVVAGCVCAYLTRRWLMLSVSLVCFVLLVINYAAATYPLALLAGFLTLLITSGRTRSRATGWLLLASGLLVAGAALVNLTLGGNIANQYYSTTGKQSNVVTREAAYRSALERVHQSPITGSRFTDVTTVQIPRGLTSDPTVSAHSDILELWMLGGVVAVLAFLLWLGRANLRAIVWCHGHAAQEAVLSRTFLTLINGFVAVGFFNPILDQSGNSLVLAAAILGLRSCLWVPEAESEDAMTKEPALAMAT